MFLLIIFPVLFFGSLNFNPCEAQRPSYTIYNNESAETATFSFQTWKDKPQLSATWKYYSNDTHEYACASGIWATYQYENYESRDPYQTSVNPSVCGRTNFVDTNVGSLRFVGDVGVPRFNLYWDHDFMGNSTSHMHDQPFIPDRFWSLILVGDLQIQLYRQPNYNGSSTCVQPTEGRPFTLMRVFGSAGYQSVKFGCDIHDPKVGILREDSPGSQLRSEDDLFLYDN